MTIPKIYVYDRKPSEGGSRIIDFMDGMRYQARDAKWPNGHTICYARSSKAAYKKAMKMIAKGWTGRPELVIGD